MVAKGEVPSQSQELIFLDVDDDLGTVRAKLESSPADEVFLVIPRRAATLRTPLEYRMLARIAHELSTDVTVVSAEPGRRSLARQEGLRARRGYASVRHLLGGEAAPRSRLPSIPEWVPLPSLTAVFVLGVLAAIIGAIGLVALPVMRVTVTPASDNVQRELELIVDPNQKTPDPARAILPGEIMQLNRFEVAGSVPTTGQRNFGRDPARGEVVFSNGTENPILLPPRTIVVAKNGARFLTDAELRVNSYSYGIARVGVTAEQRGVAGNVDANQMAGVDPPIQGLTVTNVRPMTGGADRPGKAATQADLTKLKEQLMDRGKQQAMAEFSARGGQAKSVPPNTLQLRIESENYQPAVDAEADQVSGSVAFSASVVSWDNEGQNSLNALVQKIILSKYDPDYELPLQRMQLTPPEVLDVQNQRMRVRVKAQAVVLHSLDPQQIAVQLRGKSASEARSLLQGVPGLAGLPGVDIEPSWAPRAYRIEVAVAAPK